MTTFSDLSLDPRVLQAVIESGYTVPTPIQVQAIPHALEGRDVLGIAQTGTGKTAGFVLPMLCRLSQGRARARMPRSLVLAPTRELAAQVAENFEKYSKHLKLSMALLIGGVSFKDQDKLIDRGVDVLIATPGRLLDHFERGKLMLTGVQIMVVDEADRMLDMGFIPDIERIFKMVPFTRQTLFFSATMAPEITRITQEFLHNPVRVEVARQATASETIDQFVVKHTPKRKDTAASEKREVLRRVIRDEGDSLTNGIIFCNRKVDVDIVAKSLKRHGFDAQAMHGDLDQKLRMKILQAFRDGELKLLIASDVAARGLDIPNVSHIFNFDVPIHSEDYVHRIGRTGRAGRLGKSITLCLPHEEKYLEQIEELVKKAVPIMENPLAAGDAAPAPVGSEPKRAAPAARRRPARGAERSESPSESAAVTEDAPVAAGDAAPAPAASEPKRKPAARRRPARGADRSESPSETVAVAEEPAAAAPAPEPEPEPTTAAAPEPQREPARRPERSRDERNGRDHNERRDRGRGDGNGGKPVQGMGDHVPAFLLRDFRIGQESPAPEADEAVTETQAAAAPEVPAATASEPAMAPAPTEAATAETTTEEPAAEKPKPARRRRVTAPAAA